MPKLTSEPDSTGGESKKKLIIDYVVDVSIIFFNSIKYNR
jgi:hypothetical protein